MSTITNLKKEINKLDCSLAGKAGKINNSLYTAYSILLKLNGEDGLLNAKEQNLTKKLGFKTEIRYGKYNGYGYERLGMAFDENTDWDLFEKTVKNFIKELKNELKNCKKTVKTVKVSDPKLTWAKRLAKLANIELDKALKIAEAKIDYKQQQIMELDNRQVEAYSAKRKALINKIERSNPLRRIEDEAHAQRILGAHDRHTNTDYDEVLKQLSYEAKLGHIDYADVRDLARQAI